jgi:L-alanine-DL-glutamate epimerase-like enolase superfamily enzyme
MAGIEAPRSLLTAYTLSLDSPEAMSHAACRAKRYPLLKIKLSGEGDMERIEAIRQARPDAKLIIDANRSWSELQLQQRLPQLAGLNVVLIEQPLPIGQDGVLADIAHAVPICADESCQSVESLPDLVGKYDYINIKLDKTGGLTEALRLAHSAAGQGFKLMAGCMGGSSLSIAPAFVVGQLCSVIDLDAPLLAADDVDTPARYDGAELAAPDRALWG